jgi:aspartyl protease family protein
MGLTVLNLDVANPTAPDQRETVEFLVDSGAVYSFVPRDVLDRLGIVPHGSQRFRLADGSTIERDRGDAIFFYAGRRGAAPVIFAEPGDVTLLGAVTLESLGLVLDAVRRDLVPLPMVITALRLWGGSAATAPSARTRHPQQVAQKGSDARREGK